MHIKAYWMHVKTHLAACYFDEREFVHDISKITRLPFGTLVLPFDEENEQDMAFVFPLTPAARVGLKAHRHFRCRFTKVTRWAVRQRQRPPSVKHRAQVNIYNASPRLLCLQLNY